MLGESRVAVKRGATARRPTAFVPTHRGTYGIRGTLRTVTLAREPHRLQTFASIPVASPVTRRAVAQPGSAPALEELLLS